MNNVTKIAIVGEKIVTSQEEANEAARFALDWNGSSEADAPAECGLAEIRNEEDEVTGYRVLEEWGARASRDGDGDTLAEFKTEAEADAFAKKYNAAALAAWSECEWITLPAAVNFIFFDGCTRGKYPQSRVATIRATFAGRDIEATGYGDAKFLRDTHSHAALAAAVENLIEEMKNPAADETDEADEAQD